MGIQKKVTRGFRVQLTPEQQALEDFKDAIVTRLQTMMCPICNAWIEGGGLHHPGCRVRQPKAVPY
jgi:hypothetical protein